MLSTRRRTNAVREALWARNRQVSAANRWAAAQPLVCRQQTMLALEAWAERINAGYPGVPVLRIGLTLHVPRALRMH
jgi:hypothetical protein